MGGARTPFNEEFENRDVSWMRSFATRRKAEPVQSDYFRLLAKQMRVDRMNRTVVLHSFLVAKENLVFRDLVRPISEVVANAVQLIIDLFISGSLQGAWCNMSKR